MNSLHSKRSLKNQKLFNTIIRDVFITLLILTISPIGSVRATGASLEPEVSEMIISDDDESSSMYIEDIVELELEFNETISEGSLKDIIIDSDIFPNVHLVNHEPSIINIPLIYNETRTVKPVPAVKTLGAGNIHNVTIDTNKRYYTAEELEKGLLYELKPLAKYFIHAQEKYGIDAVFLASIAACESGWGRYQFKPNNLFGFGNKSFSCPEECIDYVASFLKENYLTEGGKYYKGNGVTNVNTYYNGRAVWENQIIGIMTQITNSIENYNVNVI